jgi:hypothetical protein
VPANEKRGGVAIFLVLTLALSSPFYFLIAKSGQVGGGWGAYIGQANLVSHCSLVSILMAIYFWRRRDELVLGTQPGRTYQDLSDAARKA